MMRIYEMIIVPIIKDPEISLKNMIKMNAKTDKTHIAPYFTNFVSIC